MSIQDPISDLLTIIRNGYLSKKDIVFVFNSKMKLSIVELLYKERFIEKYILLNYDKKQRIKIYLKYYGKKNPILKKIVRISKPSRRIYKKNKDLPNVLNGFGVAIISTSKGILTNTVAKNLGLGGEVICFLE